MVNPLVMIVDGGWRLMFLSCCAASAKEMINYESISCSGPPPLHYYATLLHKQGLDTEEEEEEEGGSWR